MDLAEASGFDTPDERRRGESLVTRLADLYGHKPEFLVRAPGRVNLLGEHTDYNGLPVLPIAIDRSVMIAGARRHDRRVRLLNANSAFAERSFDLSGTIEPFPDGDWGNYTKAAAQAVVRQLDGSSLHGVDLLVEGNIPPGAGLSSSSALVVATALALLAGNRHPAEPRTWAEILPGAERYVGTLSGGMDQAISLLAKPDHALRIDFFPLRTRPVPLPREYDVVVCHSLVQAQKAAAAKLNYNRRVIECRLACRFLDVALAGALPRGLTVLGDLATLFPGRLLTEFLAHLASLPDRPLSLAEIAGHLGTTPVALRQQCQIPPALPDAFSIVRRVRHVFSEAERVDLAEMALRDGDVATFGTLMDASHASCRDDYEISCSQIEDLLRVCRESGAVGSRLTGAGFGGCTVSLVERRYTTEFLTRVDDQFYRQHCGSDSDLSQWRYVFLARCGAASWLAP